MMQLTVFTFNKAQVNWIGLWLSTFTILCEQILFRNKVIYYYGLLLFKTIGYRTDIYYGLYFVNHGFDFFK